MDFSGTMISLLPIEIQAKIAIESFAIKDINNDYDFLNTLSSMKEVFPDIHSTIIEIVNPHIPDDVLKKVNKMTIRELKDVAAKYNVCLDIKRQNVKKLNWPTLQDIVRKHNICRDSKTGLTYHMIDEMKDVDQAIKERKEIFKDFIRYSPMDLKDWDVEKWDVELIEIAKKMSGGFIYTMFDEGSDILDSDDESDDESDDFGDISGPILIQDGTNPVNQVFDLSDSVTNESISIEQVFKKCELHLLNKHVSKVQNYIKQIGF
jgi:hypothetical protein